MGKRSILGQDDALKAADVVAHRNTAGVSWSLAADCASAAGEVGQAAALARDAYLIAYAVAAAVAAAASAAAAAASAVTSAAAASAASAAVATAVTSAASARRRGSAQA